MGGVWPVALPAFETHLRVTGAVASVTDHVKNVLLGHAAVQRPPLALVIVRTVDVKVVVYADLYGVAFPPQTREREIERQET